MKLFNRVESTICSMELSKDGLSFVCCSNPKNYRFSMCGFYPCDRLDRNPEIFKKLLAEIVSSNSVRRFPCNWILHPDYYKVIMLPIPNVPKLEHREAIRWQIKDMIDYPLEDTTIDIFYSNNFNRSAKAEKVYVVAAQTSFLKNIANLIKASNLELISIDIRQFALRNLIYLKLVKSDSQFSVGILDMVGESCIISLLENESIYLVRKIPVAKTSPLDKSSTLCDELKRSFDYCHRELNRSPPTRLFTTFNPIEFNDLTSAIVTVLNIQLEPLSIQELINFSYSSNIVFDLRNLYAVGGALRNIMSEL